MDDIGMFFTSLHNYKLTSGQVNVEVTADQERK